MEKLNDEQRKMVEDNYALIPYMLKKMGLHQNSCSDEYYGALSLGLCKAASSFDPSKGVKFSAFACRCMTNEVFMLQRSLCKGYRAGFTTISCNLPISEVDGDEIIDFIPDTSCLSDMVEESETISQVLDQFKRKYMDSGNPYRVRDYTMFVLNVAGMRHVDIAEMCCTSQTNASTRIKATRDDLRKMLMDAGIEVNDGKPSRKGRRHRSNLTQD